MLDLVPAEVKSCPQWLVWRKVYNDARGKWDKHPISAITGIRCDVTAPTSWATFEQAASAVHNYAKSHQLAGFGFVLGYNSGVVGVDLDDVFYSNGSIASELRLRMADRFNSYTELSPSRTGLHVLTQANFAGGRRADGVEVYGQGRFFTVTGESYGTPRPFAFRQVEVDAMVAEIDAIRTKSAAAPLDWNVAPRYDDAAIFEIACAADNSVKFRDLYEGRFELHYKSQSEADYALVNIIGFYSDAPSQIARMFRSSALGQRSKAERFDYVPGMIAHSQDRKPPLIAIPALPPEPPAPVIAPVITPIIAAPYTDASLPPPEVAFQPTQGFVKDLKDWFYAQSIYPMHELSTVAALGLMAGIVGRQYQIDAQGLNLYFMCLAETGSGKDAMKVGISRIFDAICLAPPNYNPTTTGVNIGFPAARSFQGPGTITGKGLVRSYDDRPSLSFVSVLAEFSQTMTQMADERSNEGLKDFAKLLLEFYTTSTEGNTVGGQKNADKAKDIAPLAGPSLTMLCEGTPTRFYNSLTADMLSDGLLNRFVIVEHDGYPEHNPNYAQFSKVPDHIKAGVTALCQHVLQLRLNGDHRINVTMDLDAQQYAETMRHTYRMRGAKAESGPHRVLWIRAHQNLVRIAGLLAIGVNYYQPVVTLEQMLWATRLIDRQITWIVGKFSRGETGKIENDERQQYADCYELLIKWTTATPQVLKGGKLYPEAHAAGVIPYSYLQQRTSQIASMRKHKFGPSAALKQVIETMSKTGLLEKVRFGDSRADFFKMNL